jgi:topoisomerase-4 subunit A
MATRILPHNFTELLEAQIAILRGESIRLLPDFPTGGILDASDYDKGRGKVRLRAKIEIKDKKTIVIREICYGTTTESLIRSIDEAAKRGKVRIDAINDYTASEPEVEISLPRGQYAEDLVEALYAYTDCQVSLNSQIVVIKDGLPCETDVETVLRNNTECVQNLLKGELELERDRLLEKIFQKTLEQIFIENRLYKKIETVADYEKIHSTVATSLKPYHKKLSRTPDYDDRERLLQIPIRRISQFDIDKSNDQIADFQSRLEQVEKSLKRMKAFTISYLKGLLKKHGPLHPRRTVIEEIGEIDRRSLEKRAVSIGIDAKGGFIGTTVKSDMVIECTNFDKLLLLFSNGTYRVVNIPEKQYIHDGEGKLLYAGIADKETVMNLVYRQKGTKHAYVKRFVVSKFILDKEYRFLDEDCILDCFTTDVETKFIAQFVVKPKQKVTTQKFALEDYMVKGVGAKGVRVSTKEVKKVKVAKR